MQDPSSNDVSLVSAEAQAHDALGAIWSEKGPETTNQRAVLTALVRHAGGSDQCQPSMPEMKAMTALRDTCVRSALRALQQAEWIETTNRTGKPNVYRFLTRLYAITPSAGEGVRVARGGETPSAGEGVR